MAPIPPPADPGMISALQTKINSLKEQISQSEKNLSAQDEFFKAKKKFNLKKC